MIFYIVQIISINMNEVQSITKSIDDLQRKTKFKTYYELFNISENATIPQIKKNFRRLLKSKDTLNLSREEYETIITTGYQILLNNKKEYNYLLSLKFIDFLKQNYYVYLLSSVALSIFIFLIVDLAIIFIKSIKIKIQAQKMNKKDAKRFLKKNEEYVNFNISKMLSVRIIKLVFKIK
ncbi:hypothetical protein DMUE_3775 [Dictyocoela muelleri]|nr:hypothetical protein DMUE_3775 [Dictyocoela muelleri]